jgi:DNA-binding response OmpR family regulator
MKILWIENNARFAAVAGRAFLAGHDVAVVPSVAAAREAVASGDYDAVLLDYDLDDGKGTEALPFLPALAKRPRIIAVSSHEMGNSRLLNAGADAVCGKARFRDLAAILQGSSCLAADDEAEDLTRRYSATASTPEPARASRS